MFIEELSPDEVIEFLKSTTKDIITLIPDMYEFKNIYDYCKKSGTITFKTDYEQYVFTDFDFYTAPKDDNTFSLTNDREGKHNKLWLKFMYSKFGKKYRDKFLKQREQEKKKALSSFAKKFDENTKNFDEEFREL